MTAALIAPVQSNQRLTITQLQEEALALYSASGLSQRAIAGAIGTKQSEVSLALRAEGDKRSTYASVLERIVNELSDRYEVEREEEVRYRVRRKGEA